MSENNSKYFSNLVPKPTENRSFMDRLSELPPEQRVAILDKIVKERHGGDYSKLKYDWELFRRGNQWIPDHNRWKTLMFCAGRGFGKLSPLDTSIYTYNGWKTIGTLEIGDKVLDEQGQWCSVVELHPIQIPEKAYRFHFDDGTFTDSGAEHGWFSWTHQNIEQYQIDHNGQPLTPPSNWINYTSLSDSSLYGTRKTTQQIVDTFASEKVGIPNHYIFNTQPLNFADKNLPLHPFLLGLWLDSNDISGNTFYFYSADIPELITYIESLGYTCSYNPEEDKQRFTVLEMRDVLKNLNVLENKHLPEIYLNASINQRTELLKGFMTSGGIVESSSCVKYAAQTERLSEDVEWLLLSLGMKVIKSDRNMSLSYSPIIDVFAVSNKSKYLNFSGAGLLERYYRTVVRYEAIDPTPMRCITVDSVNGAYLTDRQLVPTSNTRTACEILRYYAETKKAKEIGVVGSTDGDVVGTIINGPSGIMSVCPPWNKPQWIPSYKLLKWPNGVKLRYFSAEKPDRLRGPQFDFLYMDEITSWKNKEAYDMAMFGLRLPPSPKAIITTTPKPVQFFLDILKLPSTYTIIGSSYENAANIDLSGMIEQYEGTRLGRQELDAEILMSNPNALWSLPNIEDNRVTADKAKHLPHMLFVVVAVDPAVSTGNKSAETAICAAGYGEDGHIYILECNSWKDSPGEWAKRALAIYDYYHADRIVAEVNNGGDLVISNIQSLRPLAPVYKVHASRGKAEALENPILTSEGWKTFGELTNNDIVYTPNGDPTPLEVLPIHEAECAKVTFSDGTSNIYSLEHEWNVINKKSVRIFTNSENKNKDWFRWTSVGKGNYERILTDEQKNLARRLRDEGKSVTEICQQLNSRYSVVSGVLKHIPTGNNTSKQFIEMTTQQLYEQMLDGEEFAIPNTMPIKMDSLSYIDPYLLGLWQADGAVGAAVITQKTPEDTEIILNELRRRGFTCDLRNGVIAIKDMRWAFAGRNKKGIYRDEWMIREDERIDLIRGMIDGDGSRKSNVSLSLSQSGYRLESVLDPIVDAMRSLGWYVSIPYHKVTHREPAYSVIIRPSIIDCSVLPRKNIDYVPHSSRYRTIKSIEPVGKRMVRCISVEDSSRLYLSGKGMVATHNSVRAEPVASLYERNKVHHVGLFGKLESQMIDFPPSDKKTLVDCVDALVWAISAVMEMTAVRTGGGYNPAVGGYRTKLLDYIGRQVV